MVRRVKLPDEKFELFKSYTSEEREGIFKTMKDVFMMSVGIGYSFDKKEKIKKSAPGRSIDYTIFNGPTDEATINGLGLVITKDLKILLSSDDQYDRKFTLMEEYANAGISKLKELVMDRPGDPVENLAELILMQEKITEPKSPGEDILSDLSKDLF